MDQPYTMRAHFGDRDPWIERASMPASVIALAGSAFRKGAITVDVMEYDRRGKVVWEKTFATHDALRDGIQKAGEP